MSSPLVVGLGRSRVDFVGVSPRLPEPNGLAELSQIAIQAGGNATVALATVAALGCRARLATRVAGDFLGRMILDSLQSAHVETSHVQISDSQLSGMSFAAHESGSDTGLRFVIGGDIPDIEPGDLDIGSLLDGASALVLDGAYPAAQAQAAERARARHIPVIFDGTSLREGTGELVALADVVILSERLASELAPRGELSDSLVELQRMGPRVVVITLGTSGSIGLHGDQLVEQPSFRVEVVDSDGAGDVYLGAFAAALVSQFPFARCMQLASATSALSCTELGAWAGIPTKAEVVDLIKSQA